MPKTVRDVHFVGAEHARNMGADVVLGEAQFLGVVERVDEESVRVRAQGGDQGEVPYEIFVDLQYRRSRR